tara:strand:+ start:2470 stop:3129 length:660 start_codon:yes stop_codon:yes gene_type:complete
MEQENITHNNVQTSELKLDFDITKLKMYDSILKMDTLNIPSEHLPAYEIAKESLQSKQCNEPYERMISESLGLYNNPHKHGFDGWNTGDGNTVIAEHLASDLYEYKPCSSNPNNPIGTINDDTIAKIDKYKELSNQGKKVWLILAGVNKQTFSLDCIYKFPAEIYDQDRRNYLKKLIEKNKNNVNDKQTRSTYGIGVNKSIQLCKDFNKVYYFWKRDLF